MSEAIEVLGVKAKRVDGYGYRARTPLGTVWLYRVTQPVYGTAWRATWWPRRQRLTDIVLLETADSAADAAREATRRLRAIMRVCARAGAL